MPRLTDVVKDPAKRRKVVDDCVALIDAEVADKHGFSGLAIKAGYKTVQGLRPGFVGMAMNNLLDDFSSRIDPFWEECQKAKEAPRAFFARNKSDVANALLAITDDRARRAEHKVVASAYQRLRPMAVDHVGQAMPRLADLLQRHAA